MTASCCASARGHSRLQRFACIENEAAAPEVGAPDFLEVVEDPAFQLPHVDQPGFTHVDRGFLAADASCAEAHHRLAFQFGLVRIERSGEFAESGKPPVDRAGEGAVVDLEGVSRVERHYRPALVVVAPTEPAFGCLRVDRGRTAAGGLYR